jgi:CarD family transcriptional regulator
MSLENLEIGGYVVYPVHGVGKLVGRETHEIAGQLVELFVINFERERMTLRIPKGKASASGLRSVFTIDQMEAALEVLRTKVKGKKAMWSRRAAEYDVKINSGDPKAIAEVLRDLYKTNKDIDQSFSERQIYQAAMDRFVREYSVITNQPEDAATQALEDIMRAA